MHHPKPNPPMDTTTPAQSAMKSSRPLCLAPLKRVASVRWHESQARHRGKRMSLCKLCGEDRPLVEAHIIPESMYPFDEPREPLLMVPSSPEIYPGRSRRGVYDRELVCEPCEAKFSPWDDYANRLLRKEPGEHDYTCVDGEPRVYTVTPFDYPKLKLFFVSLLWRASESNQSFFAHVSVGPKHTARLREMIWMGEPGEPEEFSVFLVRLTHHDDAHKTVMSPQRQTFESVRFWRFQVAGYMCDIKVDQRPTPPPQCRWILRPNEPLRIMILPFNALPEFKHMVRAVRQLDWL